MATKGQSEQLICRSLVEEFHSILKHAQQQSQAFRRLRMDLRCVRIAVMPITAADLSQFSQRLVAEIGDLERCLRFCIQDGILYGDAQQALEELDEAIPTALTDLNNYYSARSPYEVPLRYVLIYPGDFRVCRRGGYDDSRYNVLAEVETIHRPIRVSFPGWTIYEHIDILCSGKRVYDPLFFTEDGADYFTQGRVFKMLWDLSSEDEGDAEFFDEDPDVEEGRTKMGGWEGAWTGPYEGPTTVRSFLVFKQGEHSCLCLPISTLASQGVSMQLDQHNYGIIYSGNDNCTPMNVSSEDGMILPTLHVPAIPIRDWPTPNIKGRGLPDPPIDRLPTHDLLENSRVDYRRICEVQFGVRVKNVGILDQTSLQWLKSWVDHQENQQTNTGPVKGLATRKGMNAQ